MVMAFQENSESYLQLIWPRKAISTIQFKWRWPTIYKSLNAFSPSKTHCTNRYSKSQVQTQIVYCNFFSSGGWFCRQKPNRQYSCFAQTCAGERWFWYTVYGLWRTTQKGAIGHYETIKNAVELLVDWN